MQENQSECVTAEVGDVTEFILGLMKERTPEKAGPLQEVVDSKRITFRFEESQERVFYTSNSGTGVITIGLNCTTRLMAHAYAYLSANFAQIERLRHLADRSPIPVGHEKRNQAASELLTWAVTKDLKCKLPTHAHTLLPDNLPDDLVGLLAGCLEERHQDKAGELFANALVWILYHEIAHIQMEDVSCSGHESIEQENRADRMAAEWMLASVGITPVDQWKRQVGIAIALGWITAPVVYLGPGRANTHPQPYDRLFQTVDAVVEPDQQDVWLFVQMILILHMVNRELAIDEARMTEDFRENCNYLIDVISRLPSR